MKLIRLAGKTLRNLKDEEMLDENGAPLPLGESLANILVGVSARNRDTAKCVSLALRFLELEDMQLDAPDIKVVQTALRESGISVILSYRLNELFDTAEEVSK